ncbi:MAG: hypothetical protein JWN72_1704, partial [Thermoleophilia bacterium]|nr:hypothetical protein [Thermoleophilia bacterium]
MHVLRRQLRLLTIAIVAAVTLVVAPSAMAATKYWSGAADTDWQVDGNWVDADELPSTKPVAGDNVVVFSCDFNNDPVVITNVPATPLALGSLNISDGDCGGPSLSGATVTSALSAADVVVDTATLNDLKVTVTTGGNGGSAFGTSGGDITLNGVSQLNSAAVTEVTVAGNIAIATGASMTNAGHLTVASGNDLTGLGSFTNTGTIDIEGSTELGASLTNTGTFTVDGGDFDGNLRLITGGTLTTNGAGVFTVNGTLDLAGGLLTGNSTHITNSSTGLIQLSANSSLGAQLVSTGSIQTHDESTGYTLTGVGSGSITVNDAEINGQTNGVEVARGGSLSNLDVTLNGNTYLSGHGNITGDVTVNEGATLEPSNGDAGSYTLSGLLNVTGNVAFNAGSSLYIIARGTGAPADAAGTSRLDVTGTTAISQTDTTLEIATSFEPTGS